MENERHTNCKYGGQQTVSQRAVLGELVRLHLEVRQLAISLRSGVLEDEAADMPMVGQPERASEDTVRTAIRSRSQRGKFFPKALFADPAWDMLIDLYASKIAHQRVSVSSLCIASNVPAITALRWIDTLVGEGLIVRTSDAFDKRRHFVSLTETGLCAMDRYFASVSDRSPAKV